MSANLLYPDQCDEVVSLIVHDLEGFPPFRVSVHVQHSSAVDDHNRLAHVAALQLAEWAFEDCKP